MASLGTVLVSHEVDASAVLSLSVDFLNGLSFLHNKGIMHRDINPNNLAVTSFNDIRGVIIDLDSATDQQVSRDHYQGTIPYLAPEIISLKQQQSTAAYDKSVDVWALGLSLFAMHTGRQFRWTHFCSHKLQSSTVTEESHAEFHAKITRNMGSAQDTRTARFLALVMDMTAYNAGKRPLTSKALQLTIRLKRENCQGSILLKRAHKRSLEESRQG